jgi:hypothetical protein
MMGQLKPTERRLPMQREVFDDDAGKTLRIEEAMPTCDDYCDKCGECLYCCGADPCDKDLREGGAGEHRWLVNSEV